MKFTHHVILASIIALATSAAVSAQGIQVQVQPKVVQVRPKVQPDDSLLPADALQKLKLTNEQNEKYGKLDTEYKEKAKAANDKYQNDIKELRDREQFKDAKDKMQDATKKARDAGLGKLEPILTAEQKAVLKEVQAEQPKVRPNPGGVIRPLPIGGGINPVLPPATLKRLQLTEEQQKQIAEIQKEVEAKIMKVLTEEQKKQLKKGPVIIRPLPIQPVPRIQIQPVVPNVQPAVPNPRKD
jgi:Spy/CpxP family protein refolding chaperone